MDVRLLVPGASDLPVLRNFTRVGYRELLRAGVRIFEWRGPMMHAKTLVVADRRWARVGSSNLNVSSLLGNYELDVLADNRATADVLAAQFRTRPAVRAGRSCCEPRRRMLPARLVGRPRREAGAHASCATAPHKRSGYELGAVAVVALRRVAGGLRRTLAGAVAAFLFLVLGVLLLVFPRVMGRVWPPCCSGWPWGSACMHSGSAGRAEREDGD